LFGKRDVKRAAPVRDVAALAAPLAVPAVHIVKTDAPSRSHFGGSPNLPPGIAWPERGGSKLGFLARLSLPEMHAAQRNEWLPDDGALLFFYDLDKQPWGFDPKDRGGWSVLFVPDLPAPVAHAHAAAFRRIDVLPSFDRDAVAALAFSTKESDLYAGMSEDRYGGEPRHQVGGYPAPIQGDGMELECQLASNGVYCGDETGFKDARAQSLAAGAAQWKLLLQMDSDEDLDVMWGDAGTIYYWVQADAARDGRFDNAWLILQCH
jgi:uncharacterized protein YwqG